MREFLVKIRAYLRESTIPVKKSIFFVPYTPIMRPDYSHKIFGDKRLQPFLRLESYTRIRR
jgi:hypothetical protein